jgi:PAS domain S-box-containing protein
MPRKRVKPAAPGRRVLPRRGPVAAGRQFRDRLSALRARELEQANRELSRELRVLRERDRNLEETRAHYTDLFDFAPLTYAVLDRVGLVLNVSLAGCRLLNLDRKNLVGHPLLAFVADPDRHEFLEHLRRCRSAKDVVESEVRFAPPGARQVTCRLYSKGAASRNANVFPTLIVDQTERLTLDDARVAAEHERDQAERDAQAAEAANTAKDRFLATVSHELRTPLTPALFAASRLVSWDGLPDQARQLAATIKRNVEFEARLIDDLLDVARIGRERISLRVEEADLHDIVDEAIKTCQPTADAKDVLISAHLVAPVHHVRADRTRLRQVFWNLLNNAIKFTDRGGRIIVRSSNVDTVVQVTIRDNGAGMDAPMLETLFAPFDRRPAEQESRAGLGLGLAICKGIIGAHRGQIWATSEGPGHGSTFGVELAIVEASQSAAADEAVTVAPVESADDSARVRRVLIVEDDHDSCEMLALFLSMQGYDVVTASTVRSGVRRLLDREWDVVVSDIGLPDGSGLEIARRARGMPGPPRRLIALTGFGSTDDIRASQDAGFDDHVVKPVDLDTLLDAVIGRHANLSQFR